MRTTLKYLSTLCASAMLLACADLGYRSEPAGADDGYVAGRQHHLAGRLAEAESAYRHVLRDHPTHVNARNGLATIHAERGDFAQAITSWRALTGNANMSSGPDAAFLFGNLGYAYLLAGQYQDAQAALEKACLLDPLNHRSWQRLGQALQAQGQDERGQQMLRQAAALREHDLRADYAVAGATPVVPAIEAAVKAAVKTTTVRPEQEWAATEVRVAADGMMELRRLPAAAPVKAAVHLAPPASAPAPAPAPAPEPLPSSRVSAVALLEIRNGNGVAGMAKALSRQMGDPGLKVTRLTNDKGFNVRQTRVEYQPPFRQAAERLAQRFGSATVVQVDKFKSSDMRLVIGRDLVRSKFVLRPLPEGAATLAAATARDKAG